MNRSLRDLELIERYFDPEVSESEKEILMEEIEKDQNLIDLFKREKLLIKTIRFDGAKQDLRFLHRLEEDLSKADQRGIPAYYYAIAASVLIFILVGVFNPFASPTTLDLYAENFTPYPNLFEPIVRGDAATNERADGFRAYENGNYQKAITIFSRLLKEKKEPGIMLLAANANLAIGSTKEAEDVLQDLILSFDELDIPAKWYLSLCYLKSGEKAKAIDNLRELDVMNVSYSTKARALLQKIE
jgi:tetratricopeptide (TPR) repeat protein